MMWDEPKYIVFYLLLKSGAIISILDTVRKAETIDVDGYLEEKTARAI